MLGRECTNVLYKKIVSNLLALCKPSQSDVPRKGQTPVCDAPWARLKNARGTALYNVVSEDETAVETSLQPANHSLWWRWCVAPVYQLLFVLAGKKATSDMAVVLYFRLPKHAAWRKTYHGWLALTGDKQSIKTIKRNRLVGQWLTSEMYGSFNKLIHLRTWENLRVAALLQVGWCWEHTILSSDYQWRHIFFAPYTSCYYNETKECQSHSLSPATSAHRLSPLVGFVQLDW